ncbi:hypothetical protein PPL_10884 [Heterostelium album PN500]|uniref:Maf-like protein n=1 Tax=Heterostelium pallidum (strain ATCC 26659 / Pp 5 / PN500) TaxID=670386 RepID=D3BS92_HETP5|nr:hypothetical protein PPL_10884 [Heterostelium album PN500]EFA75829.1 hypothetical protein PPL_10884 [Heterostelium album PN500]|eukprot:XP_020427963.1 hypothetical protein PPL_10884 [Heterostelium album PN500]
MILDILEKLNKLNIVLASGSPRRVEYLKLLGLQFKVVPSTFEENLDKSKFENVYDYAVTTAKHKTEDVYQKLKAANDTPNIIIGADSIVVLGDTILEKPKSIENAKEMLAGLSGRKHIVYTGVHLIVTNNDNQQSISKSFYEATEVEFDTLSDELIAYYVDNYKPLDKAGGYGIQEVAATSFIKSINGCYYNVTGIPIHRLTKELRELYHKLFLKQNWVVVMSTKTKERNVVKERGSSSRIVENEFIIPPSNNNSSNNNGRTTTTTTTTTTTNRTIVGSDESINRRAARANISQGDTLIRKSVRYLSPILVALLLYSIYGSLYQPTPDPPMNSAIHFGPILYHKFLDMWNSFKSDKLDTTSTANQQQQPMYHSHEETIIRNTPTVHHPHTADNSIHLHHGGHSQDNDFKFVHETHGLNPWDQNKQPLGSFFHRMEVTIDEKRDNIIASLYGTTFDYKDRLKKDLEESLKVFEETKLRLLREWNSLYHNSYDKINQIRYKAKNGYREHREIQYHQNPDMLGPLGVQS